MTLVDHALAFSLLNIPDITERPAPGVLVAAGKGYDEPLYGFLDQLQLAAKLFPSVPVEEDNHYVRDRRLRMLRERLGNHTLTYLDVSPSLTSCFSTQWVCLGFAPLSANLFARPNHMQSYFSSAFTLMLRYVDGPSSYWFAAWELKTFFDKNIAETAKQEASILSLGRGF